jgi:hypothetical protein
MKIAPSHVPRREFLREFRLMSNLKMGGVGGGKVLLLVVAKIVDLYSTGCALSLGSSS